MANHFVCGSTRSGKSTGELQRLIELADRGDTAIVCIDPHLRSLGYRLLMQLEARGLSHRILYDRLSDLRCVPGWNFLKPSAARNRLERRAENEERARAFADILCRRRGAKLATAPLTEEWVIAALLLYLEQDKMTIPLSLLQYAFQPQRDEFKHLVDNCRDRYIRDKFCDLASGGARSGAVTPADRLIRGVLGSPAFAARCGKPTFDLGTFLNDCGILIVEGGSLGNVSEDAQRTMMGAVVQQTINFVRNRQRATPRIVLALDEANNAHLVTESESSACAECQKMGLDLHILTQLLDFPSSQVTRGVLANCIRHEWFYNANADVARVAAADLRCSKDDEEINIRQLRTGERYVKDHIDGRQRVWRERVPAPEEPWGFPGLAEAKTDDALKRIQQRPEYNDTEDVLKYQEQFFGQQAGDETPSSQPPADDDTEPAQAAGYEGDF